MQKNAFLATAVTMLGFTALAVVLAFVADGGAATYSSVVAIAFATSAAACGVAFGLESSDPISAELRTPTRPFGARFGLTRTGATVGVLAALFLSPIIGLTVSVFAACALFAFVLMAPVVFTWRTA